MEHKWFSSVYRPEQHTKIFHLFMVGVAAEYQLQRLGTILTQAAVQLAKAKGFSVGLGEATGLYSQRLCISLGFVDRVDCGVEYRSYTLADGSRPFEGIAPATHCKMMEIDMRSHTKAAL